MSLSEAQQKRWQERNAPIDFSEALSALDSHRSDLDAEIAAPRDRFDTYREEGIATRVKVLIPYP